MGNGLKANNPDASNIYVTINKNGSRITKKTPSPQRSVTPFRSDFFQLPSIKSLHERELPLKLPPIRLQSNQELTAPPTSYLSYSNKFKNEGCILSEFAELSINMNNPQISGNLPEIASMEGIELFVNTDLEHSQVNLKNTTLRNSSGEIETMQQNKMASADVGENTSNSIENRVSLPCYRRNKHIQTLEDKQKMEKALPLVENKAPTTTIRNIADANKLPYRTFLYYVRKSQKPQTNGAKTRKSYDLEYKKKVAQDFMKTSRQTQQQFANSIGMSRTALHYCLTNFQSEIMKEFKQNPNQEKEAFARRILNLAEGESAFSFIQWLENELK